MFDISRDLFDEFFHAGEGTAPDSFLGDEPEPAFDLVEPGRIGGREMDVISGPSGEPASDLRGLVGGVVVDDEMNVEIFGHIGIDVTQEREERLMPMAFFTLADDLAGGDVEGGEQGGRAWRTSSWVMPSTYPRPMGSTG